MRKMTEARAVVATSLIVMIGCGAPEGRAPEGVGQVRLDSIASFGDVDLFGSVDDVLITATDVYVLDEFSKSVHRFGRDGSMKVGLSREGEGPGELLFPEGLAVTRSGDLVVLDPGTGGLNLFRTDGDSLEFLRRIPVPFIGDDVCSWGDDFMIVGRHAGALVHRVDSVGRVIESFDLGISHGHRQLDALGSKGFLVCDAPGDRIVFVPEVLGDPIVWDMAGDSAYAMDVPGRRPVDVAVTSEGSMTQDLAEGGSHFPRDALLDVEGRLVIPFTLWTDSTEVSELVREEASGRLVWWPLPDDRIPKASEGDYWILSGARPTPWVRAFRMEWQPR